MTSSFKDTLLPMVGPLIQHGSALAIAKPTVSLIIMDASDSMSLVGEAPHLALNSFVNELKTSPVASLIYAGIVLFASDAHILAPIQPVISMQPVRYHTDGNTRLYATVLESLKALRDKLAGHPANVIVSVFSDGEDNQSPWAKPELHRVSEEVRAMGWHLNAIGFGRNGQELARSLGFLDDPDHAVSVAADAASVQASVRRTTRLTQVTASGGLDPRKPITVSYVTVPPSSPPSTPR